MIVIWYQGDRVRGIRWTRLKHVLWKIRNANKILVRKPHRKSPFSKLGINDRIISKHIFDKHSVKMAAGFSWHRRGSSGVVFNTTMYILIPQSQEYLDQLKNLNFSMKILRHGISWSVTETVEKGRTLLWIIGVLYAWQNLFLKAFESFALHMQCRDRLAILFRLICSFFITETAVDF